MRHWRALLPGLLALLPAGCLPVRDGPVRTAADLLRAFRPPAPAADVVQIDVALLERPVGDAYVNKGLWAFADEQVVDLERRAVLEENGFRVGQVIGQPPTELRELLRSERSCVNPRRRLIAAGTPAALLLGPLQPECRFRLRREGGPAEVVLQQAQCSLVVVPTLTADGKTRLHFAPKVEHGEMLPRYAAAPDQSDWVMEIRRQSVSYPDLGWDVTVGGNEYLVIGAWPDQPGTLGHRSFIDGQGRSAVQRLLVLRTFRAGGGIDAEIADLPAADPARAGRPPALALQAAFSAVRASGQ
jgi:hypothetical protein